MNDINSFLDYDDKLEIAHEMSLLRYSKLERDGTMQDDDACCRQQGDSKEYRWFNG